MTKPMDHSLKDRQITISRVVAASPAKVWTCWTDPALIQRWFGPDGYSCVTKQIDLVKGGQWRFDMIGPDGTVWPNRHRFTLYAPMTRIEFLMDGDDDLVLLRPECGALLREGLGSGGLVEGHLIGGDPSTVEGQEFLESEQDADRFGIHTGQHRRGDEDDRAFRDECPVRAVVKDHGLLDDRLVSGSGDRDFAFGHWL